MNPTNDPTLKSFVDVPTTGPGADFPIQNLPYGIIRRPDHDAPRAAVPIGNMVLDLAVLEEAGLFQSKIKNQKSKIFDQPTLNTFMDQSPEVWSEIRQTLSTLLRHDNPKLRDDSKLRDRALLPLSSVTPLLPVQIPDYTDFYSSKEHATNLGIMFRGKENALLPNYLHLPVGYHGRASSIVLSGTPITRPSGQTNPTDAPAPTFGPSKILDFELEMGFFIGNSGNQLGHPIPIHQAHRYIFGMVLVNDWSARDIQKWEYQPLGPFTAKNFATTISPWVVPMEALEPFRCPAPTQNPEPLPYLRESAPSPSGVSPRPGEGRGEGTPNHPASTSRESAAIDIHLQVTLQSEKMPTPHPISNSNFKHLYWTMPQQLAHHTVTGCNLRTGDLLASGTISGPTPDSYGSMLELAWRGEKPLQLPNNESRKSLQDGDTLTLTAHCQGKNYRLGFGNCTGKILPAHQ